MTPVPAELWTPLSVWEKGMVVGCSCWKWDAEPGCPASQPSARPWGGQERLVHRGTPKISVFGTSGTPEEQKCIQ